MKKEGEIDMALLEVKNVKKIYTTRFGGNKVEALRDVNFSVGKFCVRFRTTVPS